MENFQTDHKINSGGAQDNHFLYNDSLKLSRCVQVKMGFSRVFWIHISLYEKLQ